MFSEKIFQTNRTFDTVFFEAYESVYPLSPGWKDRVEIFELYPLLVHLLLFGGSYYEKVSIILKKYN